MCARRWPLLAAQTVSALRGSTSNDATTILTQGAGIICKLSAATHIGFYSGQHKVAVHKLTSQILSLTSFLSDVLPG
jgi:hypothetical protein